MQDLNAAASFVTRTDESFKTRAQEILAAKASDVVKGTRKQPHDLWGILVNHVLLRNAIDTLRQVPEEAQETELYAAVYDLLNTISHEYLKAVHGKDISLTTPALIFQSLHGHTIPEDDLAKRSKPDWQGFVVKFSALEDAVRGPPDPIKRLRPMSALDVVGKSKLDEDDGHLGQNMWYMASHKRSRPDLATVHGFQLGHRKIHLASLSVCGLTASETYARGNLEAWISLVVLVYHSSDTRDQRMTYAPNASGHKPSGQWDIRRDPNARNPDFSVFPNHASLDPGRMTWTAFVPGEIPGSRVCDDFKRRTDSEQAPAVGFLKVSWQRLSAQEDPPANQDIPVTGDVSTTATTDSTTRTESGVDAPNWSLAVADQHAASGNAIVTLDLGGDPPAGGVSGATTVKAHSLPQLPLTEGELLGYLHKDGWLPGLVRYHDFPQSDDTIQATIKGETHVRFREILHLASVGEPLTQCGTPRQILEVAYDLAETHLQMLKRKIIHRDLSWFNVLCNPKHDPATLKDKSELTGIPCVEKIFGNDNGQPVVLLVDLDHAARTDHIWKPGYRTGIERTGTPMFVAMELSATGLQRVDYNNALDSDLLDDLMFDLKAIEGHADIYEHAFPGGSGGGFMDNFARVVELEKARLKVRPRLPLFSDPLDLHRAHHDMETVYWDLLWTFVRALPQGSDPYPAGNLANSLGDMCTQMLQHQLGNEGSRYSYLKPSRSFEEFLHPGLVHFAGLFRSLSQYFLIPWHRYVRDGIVEIDHAHHAVRRLLLTEIVLLRTDAGQAFNVALDKVQPRIFESVGFGARKTIDWVGTGHGVGSKRKLAQVTPSAQPEGPEVKRAKVEGPQVDGEVTKVADVPADDRTVENAVYEGTEIRPGSARAMQSLFRESRQLWFGTGRRG
ncbi:hypothetical protein AURDEDRAFT_162484 [Auricularia subglabra TFB-10046 SS5]|nr:hypothetical protein AURDEDRAFT_162484 [Auricularia subglabra TFB-10046 SS5]